MTVHSPGWRRAMVAAVGVVALVGACDAIGLALPARRAAADPIPIRAITLADDHRSLRLEFTGGREFSPDDPCSTAYESDVVIAGDELRIGVYALLHPRPLAEGAGCDDIGFGRRLDLRLPEPFLGNKVVDLAGQVIFLGPPDGLVELAGLPAGWELRRQESVGESPTGRWSRVYSPLADPDPGRGDSQVELIQAFDGPAGVTGGGEIAPAMVNGRHATLFRHGPTGELVIVWQLGPDGLALTGNERDFDREAFIRLAESVVPPG